MTNKPKPADMIIANAFALGIELGLSHRQMATAALAGAVAYAEQHGDPDEILGSLVAASAVHLMKGNRHGR